MVDFVCYRGDMMDSSRINKLKELQDLEQHKIIETVLNLWNTTDDDIEAISGKTGVSRKEVEIVLISHMSSKITVLPTPINQPKFIKVDDKYVCVDKIISIEPVVNISAYSYMNSPVVASPLQMSSKIAFMNGSSLTFKETVDEIIKKIQKATNGEK